MLTRRAPSSKRDDSACGSDRELLLARIEEMWADAARWPGPDNDPGYAEAVARGMVSDGPAWVRDQVRNWLSGQLSALGCSVPLEAGPLRSHVLGVSSEALAGAEPDRAENSTTDRSTQPDRHQAGPHVESRTSSDESAVKFPR